MKGGPKPIVLENNFKISSKIFLFIKNEACYEWIQSYDKIRVLALLVWIHDTLSSGKQGSISPTFYEHLLRGQIPKRVKKTVKLSSFLPFWDLCAWKLRVNTLMKLTPSCALSAFNWLKSFVATTFCWSIL